MLGQMESVAGSPDGQLPTRRVRRASGTAAEDPRVRLSTRLWERRNEIKQATMVRVHGVCDFSVASEPEYAEGLRSAVSAALDYGLDAIELGERRSHSVPPALLMQARLAARSGVPLDTVLRRYGAGYTLLNDFLIEEAEGGEPGDRVALKDILRTQAAVFDRVVAAVASDYAREAESRKSTGKEHRVERIEQLLDGALLDTSDLGYDFQAKHLGVIAVGEGAEDAIGDLAARLDRRTLTVRRDDGAVWGWLGTRRPGADLRDLDRHLSEGWPDRVTLAIGEPASRPAGWRLTHQQARAALPIALRGGQRIVRYRDVALLAAIVQDDLLCASLRRLYLAPLERAPDGGAVALGTLRAYFAADRHVSSAAAALGVKRHTVCHRLRTIETMIERPLSTCRAEMEVALRLHDLGEPSISVLPPGETGPRSKRPPVQPASQ